MQLSESNSITINAPADTIFDIIKDSAQWPEMFDPCREVVHLYRDESREHIRLTAQVNGQTMQWETERTFFPAIRGINGRSIKPIALVQSMDTSWRVVPLKHQQSLLILEHVFVMAEQVAGVVEGVTDHADAESFMRTAIQTNSTRELNNIRCAAEKLGSAEHDLQRAFSTEHTILCSTSARQVYDTLVDVRHWPQIIDACTAAEVISSQGNTSVVRIDAVQGGLPVWWETHRTYHHDIHRIDFHLPVPMPLLESMSGQWRVVALGDNRCLLHVSRNFLVKEDVSGIRPDIHTTEEAIAFIHSFACENGDSEMRAIRDFVKQQNNELSFSTSYDLPFSPDQLFRVMADAAQWPQILPHCTGVDMLYDDQVNQEFLLSIATAGGEEKFRSIRHCDEERLEIRYFQPQPPVLLSRHEGKWEFLAHSTGCRVIARHTISINSELAEAHFNCSDAQQNRIRIQTLIANNSKAAIDACSDWLECKG